jgi:uncharacterized protein (DUF1501 family)
MMNRRQFLALAGGLVVSGSLDRLLSTLPVSAATANMTLVVLIQRGAMDGLAAATPYADPEIYKMRPRIALPVGTTGEEASGNKLLRLDDRFGLHPALSPLAPLFRSGSLAVVHGVGQPIASRSHFEAQDLLETASPNDRGATGWLNRATAVLGKPGPLTTIALSGHMPRILLGPSPAVAISSLNQFGLRLPTGAAANEISTQYKTAANQTLRQAAISGFDIAPKIQQASRLPTTGNYPGNTGRALRQIGQLIRADLGVSFAVAESSGWDNHTQQGAANGAFANAARELSQSIGSFWHDLGSKQANVVLITLTEFGRTAIENGSGGTDHGRGSVTFVLGGGVKGGKVYGKVPFSLTRDNLEDKRDLPITTDTRAVLSDILAKPMGIANTATILPGWQGGGIGLFG